MTRARIRFVDKSTVADTNEPCLRITTDLLSTRCAFDMPRIDPEPRPGTEIDAGPHHVTINGVTYDKLSWWYDPARPLT